jgi:hypothetical protein
MKRITIRMEDDLYIHLREVYAQTYPQHRLTWNSWLISLWKKEIS